MEVFLNIVWVVIAAASLCVWRTRWIHDRRGSPFALWRQWTAFTCALVLLFFMVSLTDDLHSELVVFEECSAGRRHTSCLDCPHHAPQNNVTGNSFVVLSPADFVYFQVRVGSVVPEPHPRQLHFHAGLASGRAPPFTL
jgi:hypothetical protein